MHPLLGLLVAALITTSIFTPQSPPDIPQCRKVWMYPSYARIRSFDTSHTRLANKYSLYLYREQGLDAIPEKEHDGFTALDGIPALFIPGNAGSYRQVRSIAADVSKVASESSSPHYDFFAADFNEDFSAFHGRTLLDQAEYLNDAVAFILSLYSHLPSPPSSVLLVAHSMGGFVARTMLTLPNYKESSINSIISLSSPHSAPPLPFDADIIKLYAAVDAFWYLALPNSPQGPTSNEAKARLSNVSLISITGGASDAILPADYTTLGFLVPPERGFSVFTTGIPNVWSPMDHLAIVWCSQLRRALAYALVAVADPISPLRSLPLPQRMAQMRRFLLPTGDSGESLPQFSLRMDPLNMDILENDLSIIDIPSIEKPTIISMEKSSSFRLLSEKSPQNWDSPGNYKVFLCQPKHTNPDSSPVLDLAPDSPTFSDFSCTDLAPLARKAPRSTPESPYLADSSYEGSHEPFYAVHFDPSSLQNNLFIVVFPLNENSFAKAQLDNSAISSNTLSGSLSRLFLSSSSISVKCPLSTNIYAPGAWSSLLAYSLHYSIDSIDSSISPMIRQWRNSPYESKWYINLPSSGVLSVAIHAVAPYTPFDGTRGVNFEIWCPNESKIHLKLSVDWLASFKLLILRYRVALVAQGLGAALMVFFIQIWKYNHSGRFPDYYSASAVLTSTKVFSIISISLILISFFAKSQFFQNLLIFLDPVSLLIHHPSISDPIFHVNRMFLGLEESLLSLLGPSFFAAAISINLSVYYIIRTIASVLHKAVANWPLTPKPTWRKPLAVALVVILVPFYLPYQFAYVISVGIEALTVIRLFGHDVSFNYHVTFLMLMLWVLPINIPVLVVFIHNLNINWTTPFSSHHNFLAVAPILALAQIHNQSPATIPLPQGKSFQVVLMVVVYWFFYCMMYGATHTFWLHHIFNFFCGLLVCHSMVN